MKKKTTLNRFVNKLALGITLSELAFFSCSSLPQPKLEEIIEKPTTASIEKTSPVQSEQSQPYVVPANFVEDPRLSRLKAMQRGEKYTEERGIKTWLTKLSPYEDSFENAARETGLSPELLMALSAYESMGDLRAQSPTGPRGLKQLTKRTAESLDLYVGKDWDERFNPDKSILAGARYLRKQVDRFGDVRTALIRGYHTIEKLPPGMAVEDVERYADNVLNLTRKLEQNKIEYPKAKLFSEYLAKTRTREVQPGESLTSISQEIGVNRRVLEYLNPEIPDYNHIKTGTEIRIPKKKYRIDFTS